MIAKDYVWYSPKYDELYVLGADQCYEFKTCCWHKCPMYRLDLHGNYKPFIADDGMSAISCTEIPLEIIFYIGEL